MKILILTALTVFSSGVFAYSTHGNCLSEVIQEVIRAENSVPKADEKIYAKLVKTEDNREFYVVDWIFFYATESESGEGRVASYEVVASQFAPDSECDIKSIKKINP